MALRPWLIVGGIAAGALVAGWCLAPRIVVAVVAAKAPLALGSAAHLTGAAMHTPHPAALVVEASPAVLQTVASGASGRWIPGFLLGTGQTAWGPVTALPGLDWELRVENAHPHPRIIGRPTAKALGQTVAILLAQQVPGEWNCSPGLCRIADLPGTPRRLSFTIAADCQWRTGRQVSRFVIHQAAGIIVVEPPRVQVQLETFRAELPFLGNDEGLLRAWIEGQANIWLDRQLSGRPWPSWLPLDTEVDVTCSPPVRTEL